MCRLQLRFKLLAWDVKEEIPIGNELFIKAPSCATAGNELRVAALIEQIMDGGFV